MTVSVVKGFRDRWSIILEQSHAKARRSVVDLAKDPGCDGAWGEGVRLVVDDCL
jgi:hypothetical protein